MAKNSSVGQVTFKSRTTNRRWKNRIPTKAPVFKTTGCLQGQLCLSSEVDKTSTRNFWECYGKSKLPPRSSSSLDAVELHPLKGPYSLFFKFFQNLDN